MTIAITLLAATPTDYIIMFLISVTAVLSSATLNAQAIKAE